MNNGESKYMPCEWCSRKIHSRVSTSHKAMCPLKPENARTILLWIKQYIERSSSLKKVKLYPKAVRYNEFARQKKLLSYNSMRRTFKGMKWKDIIEAVIWIAVERDYVTLDDFPPSYRSLYHPTQYIEPNAYRSAMTKIEVEEEQLLDKTKQKRKKRKTKTWQHRTSDLGMTSRREATNATF